MRPATPALKVTESQHEGLQRLTRSSTAAQRDVQRARALLLAVEGQPNTVIGVRIGVSPTTVSNWRERFAEEGLKGLGGVRPGRGRKPQITAAKVAEIVRATLHDTPAGEAHWSCRTMAAAQAVSPATVQRIWSARGIQPHRVKTFKLSNDPNFEDKLVDVGGLYLNPPENAIVLCVDEKVRHEALSDSSGVKDPDAGPPQRLGGS